VKPLQFADLVASAIRHGAIGPAGIIRRVIVLDVKRSALSPVGVTGLVNLKAGASQARSGRRGDGVSGTRQQRDTEANAAREVKVLKGLSMDPSP
jgi:hypothetical protein